MPEKPSDEGKWAAWKAPGSKGGEKITPTWGEVGLTDEEIVASRAARGREKNYFRDQLGRETTTKLLELDVANNPRAAVHLLEFLNEMGVDRDDMAKSRVVQHLKNTYALGKFLEEDTAALEMLYTLGLGEELGLYDRPELRVKIDAIVARQNEEMQRKK